MKERVPVLYAFGESVWMSSSSIPTFKVFWRRVERRRSVTRGLWMSCVVITVTQEYSFHKDLYSGVSEAMEARASHSTVPNSHNSTTPDTCISRRYKTEDNHYLPIPDSASSFSRIFFYEHIRTLHIAF